MLLGGIRSGERLMWGCVLVAMRLMRGEVHWVVTIGNGWLVTLQLAGAIPSQDEGTWMAAGQVSIMASCLRHPSA